MAFGLFHGLFFLPVMLMLIGTGVDDDQDEIGINEANMLDTRKEEVSKSGVDNPHYETEIHTVGC